MAAPIVRLGEQVYRIPTMRDYINSFAFVEADGSVTLVDCGIAKAPARIVRGLAAIGKSPTDVTRIVLTHAHPDHAGGAAEMVDRTGVEGVEVHESDAEFTRTGTNPPRDQALMSGRLFERFSTGAFAAVAVQTELCDGDVLDIAGGLRVVHTPGHTPGHVSLLHPASGVLITGDSIFNLGAWRTWPLAAFCTSYSQSKQTAALLADLEFSTAAFTHGPEIAGGGRTAVRNFLRGKGVYA